MAFEGFSELGIPGLEDAEEIGSGGFGTVYRARQPALDRTVAVKVLREPLTDAAVRRRFERECKAMGTLSGHPYIVTIHATGQTAQDTPYILMDYMPGGSLADRLATTGPMSWQGAIDLAIKVASGLEAAHRAGVLHRDLKPANILISSFGEPKLADFGIAQIQDAGATRTQMLTASVAHAAPELFREQQATERSDLYSLGSTLFTMLTGRLAFTRDTDDSLLPIIFRIINEPVPDLRLDGVPDALAAVIERLTAKDPGDRYESAEQLARALQQLQRQFGLAVTRLVVEGEPPEPDAAGEPTLETTATRSVRRSLILTGVGLGLLALTLTAFLAGSRIASMRNTAALEIVLEPADAVGIAPFTPPAGGGETETPSETPSVVADPTEPSVVEAQGGATPGLYGGTGDVAVCDAEALVAFLAEHPAEAQAWVDALNSDDSLRWSGGDSLTVDQIGDYVAELTPVVLLADTRVTNNGFAQGRATPRQAVLQAGTAILVDRHGAPRVRCACGNPLLQAEAAAVGADYVGEGWAGFDPISLVVVMPAEQALDELQVRNTQTGEIVDQPLPDVDGQSEGTETETSTETETDTETETETETLPPETDTVTTLITP